MNYSKLSNSQNEQLQQQIQKPQGNDQQIQFQTDPEKVLQISSLQAECVNLKKQIQDVEQQRKDDLKSFEKMLGEGVNETQVIGLTSDKQQLQSDLRQLQNKCDQLQQEQIALQNQLLQKNKQIVDLQDETKQSEKEEQIRGKDNEIKLLEQQNLQQQNLTPGGQKEKILQQTKEIHDQEEVINELQQKVETEVPQLQGQLSEAQEKLKDAQKDAELWNKKANKLKFRTFLPPEEIEKLSSEEAKNALTQLNKQYSDKAQENKELEMVVQHLRQDLDSSQEKVQQQAKEAQQEKSVLEQQTQLLNNQLKDLVAKEEVQRQEILDLKNKLDQENADFWKKQYQQLSEKQPEISSTQAGDLQEQQVSQQEREVKPKEILNEERNQMICKKKMKN
ncbi:unnamed protein product (macronuclear) [Paramecium tetraurelia]|uniref:Uncharacterized protein n=1 Tax=Paramecium tetraurelia TaxID=5888 RepID=A0CFQ3_PARTE|nr:uncharacterized protein GSPATT00038061001 [Paramecium tetraurelia]CAK69620.1 unnamed protein product [Paramecium tetraurelia]|eukprot:XP_001437017.1 hypothetical protein (macronuclear) [Paramecium tetraurelia strain d4-2]